MERSFWVVRMGPKYNHKSFGCLFVCLENWRDAEGEVERES